MRCIHTCIYVRVYERKRRRGNCNCTWSFSSPSLFLHDGCFPPSLSCSNCEFTCKFIHEPPDSVWVVSRVQSLFKSTQTRQNIHSRRVDLSHSLFHSRSWVQGEFTDSNINLTLCGPNKSKSVYSTLYFTPSPLPLLQCRFYSTSLKDVV